MKIIDEKGRLFGKINIIDFLAILFLLFFVPMFYFGFQVFNKHPEKHISLNPFVEKEMNFKFTKVAPDTLKLIKIGDKEIDENGNVIGQIIWLGQTEPHRNVFDNGLGIIQAEVEPALKDLLVRLKLKVEVKDNAIYYKNQKIEAGGPINFKTDKYNLAPSLYIEEKIELFITLKELSDDQLKLIAVGDKELDNGNDAIFEILSLGKVEADKREINLGGGNFTLGEDNSKKQIATKMRLKCNLGSGNKYYFKGEELSDHSLFEFNTNKYSLIGKIQNTYTSMQFYKERWVRIQVKFFGIIPEVASMVKEGDTEKSPDNNITAKIVKIVTSKAGDYLTIKDNKFFVMSNPFQKDIIVSLDILCFEKDGTLYFKNYPVKMGNPIMFSTDIYSLTGLIIGIEAR